MVCCRAPRAVDVPLDIPVRLNRLVGSLIVLFIIVSASFFLMRFAPGGPFDEERELPANVKANRWLLYDMGVEVVTPAPGIIIERAALEVGAEYAEETGQGSGEGEEH